MFDTDENTRGGGGGGGLLYIGPQVDQSLYTGPNRVTGNFQFSFVFYIPEIKYLSSLGPGVYICFVFEHTNAK